MNYKEFQYKRSGEIEIPSYNRNPSYNRKQDGQQKIALVYFYVQNFVLKHLVLMNPQLNEISKLRIFKRKQIELGGNNICNLA